MNFLTMDYDGTFVDLMFYCSYFNLMPLGYGNWFPVLTVLFSILLLLLHFKKDEKRVNFFCQSICVFTSVMSWAIFVPANGAKNVTVIGVTISVIHFVALIVLIIFYKDDIIAKAKEFKMSFRN